VLRSPTVQNVYQPGWAILREASDDTRAWNNMYDAIFARVSAPRLSWVNVIRNETVGACWYPDIENCVTRRSLEARDTRISTPLQTEAQAETTVGRGVGPGGSGATCYDPNRSRAWRYVMILPQTTGIAALICHAAFTLPRKNSFSHCR